MHLQSTHLQASPFLPQPQSDHCHRHDDDYNDDYDYDDYECDGDAQCNAGYLPHDGSNGKLLIILVAKPYLLLL